MGGGSLACYRLIGFGRFRGAGWGGWEGEERRRGKWSAWDYPESKGQRTTRVEVPEGKGVVWKKLVLLAGWGKDGRSWYGEQVVLYMFVMLVWVSAVLDRDVYHELWPPPPGSVHRMFSGQTPATASPLTWPHIQPQRCLPMCGLGGVTCPRIKRGPLHRRCNAKTKPRPTHPLVRRAITPKHGRHQSSPGWFAGSANRAVPTNPETPSMKPFLARIVCLFRHIFSHKPLPLSHKRSDAGFGPPCDDGHRPMGRDHGARLRSRSRCRRSLTAIVNSDLFMTPYPG